MRDMNEFLKGVPEGLLDDDSIHRAKTIFNSLDSCFSVRHTRVENIELDEERKCIMVILRTPYMSPLQSDTKHFADLFRIADAVGFHPIPVDDDDCFVDMVFTVASD